MEKFTIYTGTTVPLMNDNIDTDQILPKQFLKLIDKKGKLFGLINAIDLCIIVVVVVLIAGAVYKFKFMDKTSNTAAMQNVTYTVKIEKIRNYVFDNVEVGDELFDKTSGNDIGKIVKVDSEQATENIQLNNGTYIKGNVENRINVILTVEAPAVKNSSGTFVNRTYELLVGSQKKFMTKYFECDGYINSIEQ